MIHDSTPVARPVIHKWSVDNWPSRCGASARDLRRTIFDSRTIARPVIDTRAIDDVRTVDDSAAAVRHGSLDRSLDRIRHEGVVVHGSPISRLLDRSLYHVGHDRVIAILS
jgi:hypothetical protein